MIWSAFSDPGSTRMSAGAFPKVPGLNELLRHCRIQIRTHTFLRGIASVTGVLAGLLLIVCLLDYLLALNSIFRAGMLGLTVAGTSFAAWRYLLRPLSSPVSRQEMGAIVDLSCPGLHEAVATLLSVESPEATEAESGSSVMRYRLRQQVAAGLKHVHTGRIVDYRSTIERCGIAVCCIILIMMPLMFWTSGSQLLLQRLITPWANLATASNFWFEVPNADRFVAKNSDVKLIALPRWRIGGNGSPPGDVVVELRSEAGLSDRLEMSYDEISSQYTATLPRIQQAVSFRIRGGGAVTQWFRLNVDVPPEIVSALLTETPPAWTGRPAELNDGVVGDIEVFERSQLEILLKFNKPVQKAQLVWSEWKPISSEVAVDELELPEEASQELQPEAAEPDQITEPDWISGDGLSVLFRLSAKGGGPFEFRVVDEFGLQNPTEPERRLVVVEDQPPVLNVQGVQNGLQLKPDDIVPLDCQVSDDLGIGSLQLHIQKNEEEILVEEAESIVPGSLEIEHQFRFPLSRLKMKAGETVAIRVRATDQRPVPEPHEVWSGPWVIEVTDDAAAIGQKALSEEDQQLISQLKEMARQLDQDIARGNELRNQLWQQWNDETQSGVQQLSEKEQLQGRELQQLAERVAEHPLMQPQADALKQIGDAVRDPIPASLSAAVKAERGPAAIAIQDAVGQLASAKDRLNRTIEEIEKLARLEQELAELNRLALEAEELAKRSDEMQKEQQQAPETGQSPEDAEKQKQQQQERAEQLEADRQQLSGELSDLLRREKELLESARRSQLEKLEAVAEKAAQLAGQQQKVADGVAEEARDEAREGDPLAEPLKPMQDAGPAADKDGAAPGDAAATADAAAADATAPAENEKSSEPSSGPQPSVVDNLLDRLKQLAEASDGIAESLKADRAYPQSAAQHSDEASQRASDAVQSAQAGQFSKAAEQMRQSAEQSDQAASQLNEQHQDRQTDLQNSSQEMKQLADVLQQLQQDDAAQSAAQQRSQSRLAEESSSLPGELNELSERLGLPDLDTPQQSRQASDAQKAASAAAQSGKEAADQLQQEDLSQASESGKRAADQLNQAAQLARQGSSEKPNSEALVPSEVGDSVTEALQSLDRAGQVARQSQTQQAEESQPSQSGEASDPGDGSNPQGEQSGQPDDASSSPPSDGEPNGEQNSAENQDSQASGQKGQSKSDGKPGKAGQGQPSEDEDSGQPSGQSSSNGSGNASKQLSQAAKALANAARGALPRPFTPGQMTDGDRNPGQTNEAVGNDDRFDGQTPGQGRRAGSGLFTKGGVNDLLDEELSESGRDVVDGEYSDLIRQYRRELARAAAGLSGSGQTSGDRQPSQKSAGEAP